MEEATPPVASAFEWRDGPAGQALVCTALHRLAPHVFTTRVLTFRGATADGDWRRVAESLDVGVDEVLRVRQVHGRAVALVRPAARSSDLGDVVEADAVVSTDPARAITVRVADCVPILLADRGHRVVGAVHAGWRGTAANVAAAAVEAIAALGIPPDDLVAALGPSIGPCCYQVDAPVHTAFLTAHPQSGVWFTDDGPGRWRLDLWRANGDQLAAAGLARDAIHQARLCSADHRTLFHSFRRDGAPAGRMVAGIRLRS
jgi:YfiH family protein